MLCNETTRLSDRRGLRKCMWSGFGDEGWLAGSFWSLAVLGWVGEGETRQAS